MSAISEAFKVVVASYGNDGWKSVHISIDVYLRPPAEANNKVMGLTFEMISEQEIDTGIDELINQLNVVRGKAKKKLKAIPAKSAA
jgi:hypothetical protein